MKMRRKASRLFALLLFSCFLLLSCSKKEEKIPETVIPKEKMVLVLVDIHLAEAGSQFNVPFDNSTNIKQAYYQFIFKKHKITYPQLMKSWTFYTEHPEIFSEVYNEVITELSKKQAAAESKKQPADSSRQGLRNRLKETQDSLRLAPIRRGVTVNSKRQPASMKPVKGKGKP